MPARLKNPWKKTKTLGQVQLWKDTFGNRFIRFRNSSIQPHEIPSLESILKRDYLGQSFVTSMKTRINGKNQTIWIKETGSESDYQTLADRFKKERTAYARNLHHARVLRQLNAAGFKVPEVLGILYPKGMKRPFLLTTHVEGKFGKSASNDFKERLKTAGFHPRDLHGENVIKRRKGNFAIVDASLFEPTNKKKFADWLELQPKKEQEKPGFLSRILKFFGLK